MDPVQGAHFNNISWPSLCSPGKEVGFVGPAVRPGNYYLSDPAAVFKFTLYWTLIFHIPFNFIAGIYAFFNFLFPPARSAGDTIVLAPSRTHSHLPARLHLHPHSQSQSQSHSPLPADEWPELPRVNARRSRWTFALFVFLAFIGSSLCSAVVGAVVLSFVLVGVYRAGEFYISTWIPFIWAVIQSLIALLGIWPSIIDII